MLTAEVEMNYAWLFERCLSLKLVMQDWCPNHYEKYNGSTSKGFLLEYHSEIFHDLSAMIYLNAQGNGVFNRQFVSIALCLWRYSLEAGFVSRDEVFKITWKDSMVTIRFR